MKKINFVFNVIIALGVFMILGAAGSSDTTDIAISEIFTFLLSGISLISVGYTAKVFVNRLICTPKRKVVVAKFASGYENNKYAA